jgi:hypothetical protein
MVQCIISFHGAIDSAEDERIRVSAELVASAVIKSLCRFKHSGERFGVYIFEGHAVHPKPLWNCEALILPRA